MYKWLLPLAAVFLISACAVTGPAEDQWDQEEKQDKLDLRKVIKDFSGKEEPKQPDVVNPVVTEKSAPAGNSDAADYQEFLQYQEWKQNRDGKTDSYQEFKEYQAWKKARDAAR